jgi:neutral ceramidase
MALRAGAASVEITPQVGVELCGYGFFLERRSTGILDPLMARVLVLQSGADRIAIMACDLLGLSRELTAQTKRLIERDTGLPGAAVMLACSHTHAGPATVRVQACGEEDPGYVAALPAMLAEAVRKAADALHPAEVGFALGEVPGLGRNRVEGDAGPLDVGLAAMAVRSADGAPLATVYNATAHGVTHLHTNTLISAAWPGAASREIGARAGGEALFLAGSCGDVNPVLAHTGRGADAGALVADRVTGLLPEVEFADDVTLAAASRDLVLPLAAIPQADLEAIAAAARERVALPGTSENRQTRSTARMELAWAEGLLAAYRDEALVESLPTEIQALRIGEAVLLAHGSELFCEYGLALKSEFAPRPTFVVGYANDFIGYVPDPEDFARGGYAAATVPKMCHRFPFTTDVGSRVVAGLTELARGLGL